jgi:hypothetical protein
VAYFEATLELLAKLVHGRTKRTRLAVQQLLGYELIEAAIHSPPLNEHYLGVVTKFVRIAVGAYIDNEPYGVMARVQTVRIWKDIEDVAEAGRLTMSQTCLQDIDWDEFDGIKHHIGDYLARCQLQVATQIVINRHLRELLKASHALVRLGFYDCEELERLIPLLLSTVDAATDRIGLYEVCHGHF